MENNVRDNLPVHEMQTRKNVQRLHIPGVGTGKHDEARNGHGSAEHVRKG